MHKPAWQLAGWLFAALMALLYVRLQVMPIIGDAGTSVAGLASHTNDYKHIYLGSLLLREGLSPYDPANLFMMAEQVGDPRMRSLLPYVYLPFTGIVLVPLTFMYYTASVVAFQVFNHICLMGGALIAAWALGWRKTNGFAAGFAFALMGLNFNVFRQNNAGQLNAILFAGMAGLLWLLLRKPRSDVPFGGLAAFLMLFKLSPGIFLIWLGLRREGSRAAWMMGWAGVLTVVSVLLVGFSIHWEFLPILRDMGYGKSTWSEFGQTFWRDPYNQSINATMHRWFVLDPGERVVPFAAVPAPAANAVTWFFSLGLIAIFAASVWRGKNREDAGESPLAAASFAAAIAASLLLPSIMWDHYLVQMIVPVLILATLALRSQRWLLLAIVLTCAAVMALPIRFDDDSYASGPGLILGSVKLLPVLALFALACWWAAFGPPVLLQPAPDEAENYEPPSEEHQPGDPLAPA